MKQLILTLTVLLALTGFAPAANGPVDRGSFQIGGGVSFMTQTGELHENLDGDSYIALSIAPSVGYFVFPGVLIGIDLGFHRAWQGDYSRWSGLSIGPSVGYYFNGNPSRNQAKGAVYPYIKGFFSYGQTKTKYLYEYWDGQDVNSEVLEVTRQETRLGGEAGAIFMVSNAVGVAFSGNLTSTTVTWDYDYYDDSDDSPSGLTIMFGAGITYFVY